jgi:hypothetical protein
MPTMEARSRSIIQWELLGAVFIIVVGSTLHFAFGWTGGWRPVALIAAVNESIWEHLKLTFWPGLIWGLLPQKHRESTLLERLAVKGFGLILMATLIVVTFAGYTAILGDNLLILDIGTFVFAVLAGQGLSAVLSIHRLSGSILLPVGLCLLISQFAAYSLLTYFPPDFWLFVEAGSGTRGIPSSFE